MRLRPELTLLPVVMKQLSSCFGFLSKKVELNSSVGNEYANPMSRPEGPSKEEIDVWRNLIRELLTVTYLFDAQECHTQSLVPHRREPPTNPRHYVLHCSNAVPRSL
jgi:hypothetical protein